MLSVKLNKRPFDRSFDHFVDNFLTELPSVFKHDFNGSIAKGSVPVNVKETEKAYQLEVVAPGFEKTDFNVNLDQNLLTISADKKINVKEETDDKTQGTSDKIIRREFSYSSFKRTFTLDEKIDATKIDAEYINGVLKLNLPKKVEVKVSATEIVIK